MSKIASGIVVGNESVRNLDEQRCTTFGDDGDGCVADAHDDVRKEAICADCGPLIVTNKYSVFGCDENLGPCDKRERLTCVSSAGAAGNATNLLP